VLSDADMCWHVLQNMCCRVVVWLGTLHTLVEGRQSTVSCGSRLRKSSRRLVSAAIALACVSLVARGLPC